jgi:cardiolipin synthase
MGDDTFQWLRSGDEAYAAMLAAIAEAQRSLRLETYIFAESAVGRQFRDGLVDACRRGARVQVLLDAFGSLNLPESFWAPLLQAGGDFRWFNPLDLKRFTFRDHRKLLICDERVAFVGGYNIAPEGQGDGVTQGWRDLGLKLCGPQAEDLAFAFDAMFARADLQHPTFTRWRKSAARRALPRPDSELLLSGPGRGRNAIKRALLADLAQARRVQIIAAYFLPTGRVRRALLRVARRGGLVQLVLPGKTDVPIARVASHSLYQRFLRSGVEIYEYQPQILHTKLIVVDHACYAGSANLDTRSLHINYELMLRLTQPAVVAQAGAIFGDHLRLSQRISRRSWRASRTFWNKLKEWWAALLLGRLERLVMRWQLRRWRG